MTTPPPETNATPTDADRTNHTDRIDRTDHTNHTDRSNRWYLSSAPLLRALVHLCVPMAAGTAVSAVYNVINSGFVGSLHSTAMLAAITFGTPMLALVLAFGGVFGVGGGALVSRLLGAAEREPAKAGEIRHVSSFAVWGSVIAGAVIGGVGLLLLDPIVSALGADGAAAGPTRHYVAVMLAFVPVLAASLCLENLVRAEGAARQAMTGLTSRPSRTWSSTSSSSSCSTGTWRAPRRPSGSGTPSASPTGPSGSTGTAST
ncbi:MATE family efflux transporter [Streptomyces sp. NPDC002248]